MSEVRMERIGKFLKPVKREVILNKNTKYKLLGVKWYGKGVFIREEKTGKKIKAKKLYQVKTGDFIYNRLFAWKSSFALVKEEFDGCLVSNEFPVFIYNPEDINIKYLLDFILLPSNIHSVNQMSKGVSGVSRNRFKEKIFLNMQLPDISIQKQNSISSKINEYRFVAKNLSAEITNQQTLLKKLRQSILQDAISGKLTRQWRKDNPDVEPASELLKRIKVEKDRLIKEKKIKKQKPLSPITKEEIPFDLPKGWGWCRLGEVIYENPRNGYSPKAVDFKTKVKTLKLGATTTGKFIDTEIKYINEHIGNDSYLWLKPGDILIQRSNSIDHVGISAIYNGPEGKYIYPDLMMKIQLHNSINKLFLHKVLLSSIVREYFRNNASGSQKSMPKINQTIVSNTLIPIPSINEQKIISSCIEKLLSGCNQLESQITKAHQDSKMLMQAVLKEAFEG